MQLCSLANLEENEKMAFILGNVREESIFWHHEWRQCRRGYAIERVRAFLTATLRKFDDKFIMKRYLIDVVSDLCTGKDYKLVLNAIGKFTKDNVRKITKSKLDNKENMIKVYYWCICKKNKLLKINYAIQQVGDNSFMDYPLFLYFQDSYFFNRISL